MTVAADATPARARRPLFRRTLLACLILVGGIGTLAYVAKGTGIKSRIAWAIGFQPRPARFSPRIARTFPESGQVGVDSTPAIRVTFRASDPIDPASVHRRSVFLVRTHDQMPIELSPRLLDESTIELLPTSPLQPHTQYNVFVTPAVRDRASRPATAGVFSFTTAGACDPDLAFERVALQNTSGQSYTSLNVGPDAKLYATTVDGRILRFDIRPDGTLGDPQTIDSLIRNAGGPRLLIGLCFDPKSPPDRPVVYVTHSHFAFENAPDFSGKLTRLSGADLADAQDVVVNLPRSVGDHTTNQPGFGPDGAIYFPQASNTAFGDADDTWGDRPERQLNASILRLDTNRLPVALPIDVRTADAGGSYRPGSVDAPLTVFASGVRLAYDLVWHSNGSLYVPTNGSSSGGNAPASLDVQALRAISTAEDDWLFRIVPGRYHGHPNPAAGKFILNGGNPTDRWDFAESVQYPVGTRPDPDWNPPVEVLGQHISANGVIEYSGNACKGKLDRRLLICRYSRGNDILVLTLGTDGRVVDRQFDIPGLGGFDNPLDVAQDRTTGNLYVCDFGRQVIYLCKPK
jgi:hypothetical protein